MNEESKKSNFDQASDKLRSLTSGALRISLIILFAVAAWRIAWSNFSLDLSKFDFSDLLAMILALFAMGMSVAFYFKSTDSSNQFYDNIYNFTQKTSEILGRIEERFGERLKHLDEGYGRIEERFDGISKTPDEIEQKVKETEGKEEIEKEKLEETNKQMKEMVEQLAQRAQLEQREKQEFYQRMEELELEKDSAQERIREIEEDRDRMRHQLIMMEKDMMGDVHDMRNPYIDKLLHHPEMTDIIQKGAPSRIIKKYSQRILSEEFPQKILDRLQEEGMIDSQNALTSAGCMVLKTMARKFR